MRLQNEFTRETTELAYTCSWRKTFYMTAYVVGLVASFVYMIAISSVFGVFNARHSGYKQNPTVGRGVLWVLLAGCSFSVNAPTAWLFLSGAWKEVQRLCENVVALWKHTITTVVALWGHLIRCELKGFTSRALGHFFSIDYLDPASYIGTFLISVLCSGGTVVAGIAVARETIDSLPDWIKIPFGGVLMLFFVINTFTTRLKSSIGLLFGIFNALPAFLKFLRSKKQQDYWALAAFRKDIVKYGHKYKISVKTTDENGKLSKVKILEDYATKLYDAMAREGVRAGSSPKDSRWNGFVFIIKLVTAALPLMCALLMGILWYSLTEDGLEKLAPKSKHPWWWILILSASNNFFYMNSAWKFFPSVWDMLKKIVFAGIAVSKRLGNLFINDETTSREKTLIMIRCASLVFCLLVPLSTLSISVLAMAAFFSGAGYGEDGYKMLSSVSPVLATLYSWCIATFTPGLIVNGGCSVRFIMGPSLWEVLNPLIKLVKYFGLLIINAGALCIKGRNSPCCTNGFWPTVVAPGGKTEESNVAGADAVLALIDGGLDDDERAAVEESVRYERNERRTDPGTAPHRDTIADLGFFGGSRPRPVKIVLERAADAPLLPRNVMGYGSVNSA